MAQHYSISDYFPLTVAAGDAFCNRTVEIAQLRANIERKRPLLISSPRRYGKTSLILRTIQQMDYPYIYIDFFSAIDERDIEAVILQGIGKFIYTLESAPKKALALASSIFAGINFRVALGETGIFIEVDRKKDKPAYYIFSILERLEQLAERTKKGLILFFDEFQCLSEATSDHAIEGVLRQVAQLSKNIAFVFSGSNRHLLQQIFDDRRRPFYKLCERLALERISAAAYTKHLQLMAQKQWQQDLSPEVLDSIFTYTELHPYYINQLCSRLWMADLPTVTAVTNIWDRYVMESRSSVAAELELLSKNQRKLLSVLARFGGTKVVFGQHFVQHAGIAKATISQALAFLERQDYLYKDTDGMIRVLDPIVKAVLANSKNSYG